MKSFLSSLRKIDRSWAIFTTRHHANGNQQVSTSRYHEHKLSILGTANNPDRFSTKRSGFRLRWLLQIAGPIACTLGCQLFDVPKSLAAGVTVSGQVFSDVNSDGSNTGDSGISGVTVVLRNTTTNTCQSVSTNSSGNYSFTSILPGNYEIIEAADQTTPIPQTCTPAAGKTLAQTIGKDPTNYASTTPNVIPITVSTSNVTAKNFGDHSATSFGNCPNPAYITKGTSATTIRLNSVNLSTGALAEISLADFSAGVNGVGFNLTDAYIYGSASSGKPFNLSRINLSGTIEYLGAVFDVNGANPLAGTSFIGDVDQNGIFYSIQGTDVTAIDVNPNSPTFKRYLKKFKLFSNPGINDIAISPIDGKVYTIDNTSTSRLYRYPDFSTISNGGTATIEDLGELRNIISINTTMADGAKGSIYFAADGTLYAYRNGTNGTNNGAIYALSTTNIATPQPKFTTVTTTAPGVSQNDGARCMFAPAIPLPNTYTVSGTLYKDNNNNGVNNSEPGLGANVTVSIYDDKNSNNIIDANEQITTTTSDANGLYTLSNLLAGTYKIKVDTSDVDIPSNYGLSTPNNLSVTIVATPITGKDFGFVTPQVVGFKSAKLTDSNNDSKINPGETVTWTIDYVNTGSVDVTNFQITDILPIGVTKSGTVTLSVSGTGQAAPIVNNVYTGTTTTLGITDTLFTTPITLKVGGAIKVTIPVIINSGITGILSNQSSGTATNLPTVGIKTDNAGVIADLPTNIQSSPYNVTVPTGSISQTTTTAIDPTKITVEAAVAQTPFVCDGRFYQIRAVSDNSELFLINRFNTPFTNTSVASTPIGIVLNGLAYNPQDNFIYALMRGISGSDTSGVQPGKTLYRFGNGSVAHVGNITNLPDGFTPTAADFGSDGTYYVTRAGGSTELYKINIATQTATLTTMTQNTGNIGDMAYNPKDNFLYGIGGTGNQILFKINPVTGNVTTTNLSVSDTWGTAFFDPIGTFYGYANSGKFYRIDIVTGVATELSTAPIATASDGATCQFTSEKIDVVKAAGVVTKINPTTFDVPYTIKVKNTGAFNAPNVQISENLNQTFSTGNPTISIQVAPNATGGLTTNSSFNGIATNGFNLLSGLNSLAAGTSATITVTVRLVYTNLTAVPSTVLNNQVYASTISSTSAPGTPNLGYTFPSNVPVPPPDLLTADVSTNGTTLPTSANGDIASPTPITLPTSSNPNLLLVKRITAINGNATNGNIFLNTYDPETDTSNPSYPYDKNVLQSNLTPPNSDKWPNTSNSPLSSTFLLGARNGGTIKPNDIVEYTIYFLSAGDSAAKNVLLCDRVPANVTFSPNTFTNATANPTGVARGIAVQIGSTLTYRTNTGDTDLAQYFPSGIEPSTVYPSISCGGANNNGAVVVKLGDLNNATEVGTPPDSSGFVRFRGVVK